MANTAQQVGFIIAGMLKTDASVNASGVVYFYETGGTFTVAQNAYSDSGKNTPITSLTLDAAGKGTAYCDGTYDILIKDSGGSTIDSLLNMFFQVDESSQGIYATKVITATTATLDSADNLVVVNRNGNCVITMVAGVNGKRIVFKNMHASAGTTTINRAGGDTFDNAATSITIVGTNASTEIWFESTNSRWHVTTPRIHTHANAENGGSILTSPTITGATLITTVINTSVSGTAVLDEDDMASDSATALATQQSIKAYVDVTIGSPVFEAVLSGNQNILTTAVTKVEFDTEVVDTNSDYDNVTNFRFTPTTVGKYLTNVGLKLLSLNGNNGFIHLYKNGAPYRSREYGETINSDPEIAKNITAIVVMNGSTDYLEVFVSHSTDSNYFIDAEVNAVPTSWFSSAKVG